MKTAYTMTAADRAELAEIEADAANVKLRRKRFFAKLRQRAHRARVSNLQLGLETQNRKNAKETTQ